VGLTYRLPYSIDLDGEMSSSFAPAATTETSVEFPGVVVLGYSYRPNDTWLFEVDLDWTDWSTVDDIRIVSGGEEVGSLPLRYDDTLACKLGAQCAYSERLDLRAGYVYNQNATPDMTWTPSLPDSNVHFLTGGFSYRISELTIDGACQLIFYEGRKVDKDEEAQDSFLAGKYDTFAPCFSLAATYEF